MARYILNLLISVNFLFFFHVSNGQDLKTENIMETNFILTQPVIAGSKSINGWTGGTVTGKIAGKILPIGGEFGTSLDSNTYKLDVRAVLLTNDSATIYLTYSGYFYTDPETSKLLETENSAKVDPSRYYFRINPMFETTSSKYNWLNHTVAIGTGTITESGVSFKIYAIK